MIRKLILIAALLGLSACVAIVAPCDDDYDGGIGGTGSCVSTPAQWIDVNT